MGRMFAPKLNDIFAKIGLDRLDPMRFQMVIDPEFFGDQSRTDTAGEIIDKVVDGNASDAKSAIYSALYRKIGDAIDLMRSDVQKDMGMGSQEQTPEE